MARLLLLELAKVGIFLVRLRLRARRESHAAFLHGVQTLIRSELRCYGLRLRLAGQCTPGFIASNHTTFLDTVIGMALKPGASVSKAEVARYPLLGPVARRLGCLFVNRRKPASRDRVKREMNRWPALEKTLWVFPEGTTSPLGELLPFRRGVFKAAEATGHPVQPVVFSYSTPLAAWSSGEGLLPGIHKALVRIAELEVCIYWMRPFHVPPGGADAAAEALRKRMLRVLKVLEAWPGG